MNEPHRSDDQPWTGRKMDKYFRQVKPRPRISWPPPGPGHAVVAPPAAAVPDEPVAEASTSGESQQSSVAVGVMVSASGSGMAAGSSSSHTSHARDAGDKGLAAFKTARPRKRFRKKVSGLFGENTDLKKRMVKLFQHTDLSKITLRPDAADADVLMRQRPPSAALMDTDSLLSSLPREGEEEHDEANSSKKTNRSIKAADQKPVLVTDSELTDAARRAIGSPAKLETIRRAMGTLDPSDNRRFLDELDLDDLPSSFGGSNSAGGVGMDSDTATRPIPPLLPPLHDDSSSHCEHSTPSASRLPAVPAVLRSKTRRAERGYRSKDVVEARRKAAKGTLSSSSRSSSGKSMSRKRSADDHEDQDADSNKRRKRLVDEHDGHEAESNKRRKPLADDHNDIEADCSKRRRPDAPTRTTATTPQDVEASPVTMANSMSDEDRERERSMLHNPLTMLVEAATGRRSMQESVSIREVESTSEIEIQSRQAQ